MGPLSQVTTVIPFEFDTLTSAMVLAGKLVLAIVLRNVEMEL